MKAPPEIVARGKLRSIEGRVGKGHCDDSCRSRLPIAFELSAGITFSVVEEASKEHGFPGCEARRSSGACAITRVVRNKVGGEAGVSGSPSRQIFVWGWIQEKEKNKREVDPRPRKLMTQETDDAPAPIMEDVIACRRRRSRSASRQY